MVDRIPNHYNNNYNNNQSRPNNNNSNSNNAPASTISSRFKEDHLPNELESISDRRRPTEPPKVIESSSINNNKNIPNQPRFPINKKQKQQPYQTQYEQRRQSQGFNTYPGNSSNTNGNTWVNPKFSNTGSSSNNNNNNNNNGKFKGKGEAVPISTPKPDSIPSKIWVGRIPYDTDKLEFKKLCNSYGIVQTITWAAPYEVEELPPPYTYAYVQYTTDEGGINALKLNGSTLPSSGKRIVAKTFDVNYSKALKASFPSSIGGERRLPVGYSSSNSGPMSSTNKSNPYQNSSNAVASSSKLNNNITRRESTEELSSRPLNSSLFRLPSLTASPGLKAESSSQNTSISLEKPVAPPLETFKLPARPISTSNVAPTLPQIPIIAPAREELEEDLDEIDELDDSGDDMSISEIDEEDLIIISQIVPSRDSPIAEEPIEEAPEEEEEEAPALILRIKLPIDCKGKSLVAIKNRTSFMLAEVSKALNSGKCVISQTFDEEALIIEYILDSSMAVDEEIQAPIAPVIRSPIIQQPIQQQRIQQQVAPDIKPLRMQERAEVVAPEVPKKKVILPPVYFPYTTKKNTFDSTNTKKHAEAFLKAFFPLFDSNRAGVTDYYEATAKLSIRCVTLPPKHLKDVIQFSSKYPTKKSVLSATTPIPITNATKKLPAGSTDLDKLTYDAFKITSTSKKSGSSGGEKNKKSLINLVIHGEFEEFEGHIIRSFDRNFMLSPKNSLSGGAGSPLDYLILSDQLVFRHYDPSAPLPVLVKPLPPPPPPPIQNRPPAPILIRPPPPPPVLIRPPSPPARIIAAAVPLRQPALPIAKTINVKRVRPETDNEEGEDDSDIEIIEPNSNLNSASLSPNIPLRPLQFQHQEDQPGPSKKSKKKVLPPIVPTKTKTKNSLAKSSPLRRAPNLPIEFDEAEDEEQDEEDQPPQASTSKNALTSSASAKRASTSANKEKDSTSDYVTRGEMLALIRNMTQGNNAASRSSLAMQPLSPNISEDDDIVISQPKKSKGKQKEKEKNIAVVNKAVPVKATPKKTIITFGASQSTAHGFNGKNSKLRYFVDTGDEFLATTIVGDLLTWDGNGVVKNVYSATTDAFKVDDMAYSKRYKTLVVGYLGPVKEKFETISKQPDHQIRLFQKAGSTSLRDYRSCALKELPHARGGVTALTILPDDKEFKFISAGGYDKSIYLWSRHRDGFKTQSIITDHTSIITGLVISGDQPVLVSAGEDKRIRAYDIERNQIIWKTTTILPITNVSSVPFDPSLILIRVRSAPEQFSLYDLRQDPTLPPVLKFGSPLRVESTGVHEKTISRYLRGGWKGKTGIYSHPDSDCSAVIYDVRRTDLVLKASEQSLLAAGRTKVIQSTFKGSDTLVLSENINFTSIKYK